jgi:hypothetical protein
MFIDVRWRYSYMILHDIRKFFTKIIKPKNKILGFSKIEEDSQNARWYYVKRK